MTIISYGYAPKTWGQISSVAWDFYARAMLNEPGLEFLRLCEDSQWKLTEWTQQNYSGWAWRHGLQEARPKKGVKGPTAQAAVPSTLDNKDLFQMEPSNQEPEVIDAKEYLDLHHTTDVQDLKGDLVPGNSDSQRDTTASTKGPGMSPGEIQHQQVSPPPYL